MWLYIWLGAVVLLGVGLAALALVTLGKREGSQSEKLKQAQEAARDANSALEVSTNDNPAAVRERLRDGKF